MAITPPPLSPALPGERFTLEGPVGALVAYGPADPGAEGVPLVLVHTVNAAASAYEVRPLYERLGGGRPTYGFDLPGFGLSDRPGQIYTPRIMVDALAQVVDEVRSRHGGGPVDAIAVSLGCEFLARAAAERPDAFRSVGLISPTGFDGRKADGPPGSTRGQGWLHGLFTFSLWDDALFDNLTRPGVVRYFLRRTFGAEDIDQGLWDYAVATARAPGAKHAPQSFLSGHLFSRDIHDVYDALKGPVWLIHGTRGDFVDYRRTTRFEGRDGWALEVFEGGALPYFEPANADAVIASYERFVEGLAP
jgi:pimeloyl-ACP methyl ester carboxylesterase